MSIVLNDPPDVIIKANNWFHEGWLFGLLGLPEKEFNSPDIFVKDMDIENWREGYKMALETKSLDDSRLTVKRMCELDQFNIIML